MGFRNLSAELDELRGWSQERREGLRQLLEEQINKQAHEDKLAGKWRGEFLQELDSLDPCVGLHFLRLVVSYLRLTNPDEPWYQDSSEKDRKDRKETRGYYRKVSKGKGQRTRKPENLSIIVRFDEEGKDSFEVPGDRTGRPPKTLEADLISALFELLQLLGDAKKDIHEDLKQILFAFCGLEMGDEAIKGVIKRHLA